MHGGAHSGAGTRQPQPTPPGEHRHGLRRPPARPPRLPDAAAVPVERLGGREVDSAWPGVPDDVGSPGAPRAETVPQRHRSPRDDRDLALALVNQPVCRHAARARRGRHGSRGSGRGCQVRATRCTSSPGRERPRAPQRSRTRDSRPASSLPCAVLLPPQTRARESTKMAAAASWPTWTPSVISRPIPSYGFAGQHSFRWARSLPRPLRPSAGSASPRAGARGHPGILEFGAPEVAAAARSGAARESGHAGRPSSTAGS